MNIVKAYYYLFYKLYKISMTGAIKSLSKFYASIGILGLQIWFAISLYNYYTVFINRYATLEVTSVKTIVFLLLVLIFDYCSFIYTDKWKDYVAEFDQWPKRRNIIAA
jgi:hypothetical protein